MLGLKEVVQNPEFFRRLREALESRSVSFPIVVHDITSGSSIAKRVIAAIWSSQEEIVNQYSLLLEYHSMGHEVVNLSKDFPQPCNNTSPKCQKDASSASTSETAGPSDAPRYTDDVYALAKRTLRMVDEEERHDMSTDKKERSSVLESDDEEEEDEHQDVGQELPGGPEDEQLHAPDTQGNEYDKDQPDNGAHQGRGTKERLSVDRNVTRRTRSLYRPRRLENAVNTGIRLQSIDARSFGGE